MADLRDLTANRDGAAYLMQDTLADHILSLLEKSKSYADKPVVTRATLIEHFEKLAGDHKVVKALARLKALGFVQSIQAHHVAYYGITLDGRTAQTLHLAALRRTIDQKAICVNV